MAKQKRPRPHRHARETAAQRYAARAQTEIVGVIFDSDVIIEILRGRARVIDIASRLELSGVPTYCTPISWAEVFSGIRGGEEPYTEAFFQAREELTIGAVVGKRAGAYLARYSRSHGVELADALIAALATTTGLRLWTLNRKHYPMPDIRFYEA
jgi:predicted nucleic acid-binding protein